MPSYRAWLKRCLTPFLTIMSLHLASPAALAESAVPVVDLHVDVSYQFNYKHAAIGTLSGQCVANQLAEGGVYALVLPLYVPHEVSPEGPRLSDIERSYSNLLAALACTPPYLVPGSHLEPGRVASYLSLEGAAPFAGRPGDVARWVSRGVQIWGLVHVHDNALATSAGPGPRRRLTKVGLTDAGREVVRAIHRAHAYVDVSHASDAAVADVLELAREDKMPVFATHSNADKLAPHARNLTDDQLRGIADSGGLIGVNFHAKFLCRNRKATLNDVVQQVRYMVRLIGVEHVGIGSDFEGGIRPPEELRDMRGYQTLATALRRSGLSRAEVEQIMSGNALRLLNRGTGASHTVTID
ncbi:MAG TPA: membrane dipeptidase [Polyangiaceae bacterium]